MDTKLMNQSAQTTQEYVSPVRVIFSATDFMQWMENVGNPAGFPANGTGVFDVPFWGS